MNGIFIALFNMSVSAGWAVIAVLLVRAFIRKAPKWISCLLWCIVFIRAAFPALPKSVLSLMPGGNTASVDIVGGTTNIKIELGAPSKVFNGNVAVGYDGAGITVSGNTYGGILTAVFYVWLAVTALMLVYGIVSYVRLGLKVSTAEKVGQNVYLSEKVTSPFVFGIVRPRIYVPSNIGSKLDFVLAHENAHIKRRDHIIKPIGFIILAFHWFNPLMWLAFALLSRDIEAACDEKVVKKLTSDQRADYSEALLELSVGRRFATVCPLAFGEISVKSRIKQILNYKKPGLYVLIASALAVSILILCLLTDPLSKAKKENIDDPSIESGDENQEEPKWSYNGWMTDKGYYFPKIKIEFPMSDGAECTEHVFMSPADFETLQDDDGAYYHRAFKECNSCGKSIEAVTIYECRYNNSECKGGCLEERLIPQN